MPSEKSSIVSSQPSRCICLPFPECRSRSNETWAAAHAEVDALSAYKAVGHP
jgi:hypothetical protein